MWEKKTCLGFIYYDKAISLRQENTSSYEASRTLKNSIDIIADKIISIVKN